MARTTLTAISSKLDGTDATWTAGTADGHEVSWVPNLLIIAKNTNVAARDIIITKQGETTAGADYANNTYSIPGSGDASGGYGVIDNIESAPFRGASDGMVWLNFDSGNESDVEVCAVLTNRAS